MEPSPLSQIRRLMGHEASLLKSGQFGQGLWPVDPEVGQILYYLILTQGLRSGLEIGAGVGYSSIWMGEAFRRNAGFLISFEYFLPKVRQWERHLDDFFGPTRDELVQIVPSDVVRWLPRARKRSLDLVFFDQRKGDYLSHLKALLPYLKKGAFVCADNVLSHKKECQPFLDFLSSDSRFESVFVPLGAGLQVARFTTES